MVERLEEIMKGRRERIEKGSREGIEKRERDKKTKFEEEGLRASVSSSPQGITSWSSSIKIWVLQAYRMHYLKKCHGVKQNAKICAIGETECN